MKLLNGRTWLLIHSLRTATQAFRSMCPEDPAMIRTNYNAGDDRLIGTVGATVSFEVNKWNEIDDLVRWLKRKHAGRTRTVAEGPDARTIVLSFAEGDLVIYQWDTGDVTVRAGKQLADIVVSIAAHYNEGL